jgi:hypothetical protein
MIAFGLQNTRARIPVMVDVLIAPPLISNRHWHVPSNGMLMACRSSLPPSTT